MRKLDFISNHAQRAMRQRMGCHKGDVWKVANRAWNSDKEIPESWNVRRKPRSWYRRYGDFVFVFGYGLNKGGFKRTDGYQRGELGLVTVIGPLSEDNPWQSPNSDTTGWR